MYSMTFVCDGHCHRKGTRVNQMWALVYQVGTLGYWLIISDCRFGDMVADIGYFVEPSEFVHPSWAVLVCFEHSFAEHCVLMLNFDSWIYSWVF